MEVLAICGSLRAGSFNRLLMENAIDRVPDGLAIAELPIRGFPVYNGDLETGAYPDAVAEAKRRVASADGLLLVTPEYNFGVPGPLKNAVDWMSRPPADTPLRGKPVGTMGASTSWAGTARSQIAWLATFKFLHMPVFEDAQVHVSMAAKAFDEAGRLSDERFAADLDAYLAAFRDWLRRIERGRA